MELKYAGLVWVAGMISVLVGCGGSSSTTTPPPPPPTVTAIAVAPQNSAVAVGKTTQLSATATFSDGSQKDVTSSATWSSSDTTIASVAAGTVSGVAKGVVTITAASGSKNVSTLVNVTDLNLGNGTLKGNYIFSVAGIDSVGPTYATGSFVADGNGNVTGVIDANTSAKGLLANKSALSGTYTISPDGRGQLTVMIGGTSILFRVVMTHDGSKGKLIEYDGSASAVGVFEAATSGAQLSGNYVFRLGGIKLTTPQNYVGEAGLMTAAGGNLSGVADENFNGINSPNVTIVGSTFTPADNDNRGTLQLTLADDVTVVHLVYYMVSANRLYLMSVDPGAAGVNVVAGIADAQTTPVASLSDGDYTFLLDHGATASTGTFEKAGKFTLTGGAVAQASQGSIVEDFSSNTVQDQTFVINPATAGTCSAGLTNGRGNVCFSVTLNGVASDRNFVIYPVSASKAYLLETTAFNNSGSAGRAGLGEMETSTASSATGLPVAGDFIFSQSELGETNLLQVGQLESDGNGGLTGIIDFVAGAGGASPTISAAAVSPKVGWVMAAVAGFPFDYSITPQNIFVEKNFFYMRPDGNRVTMLGFFPDTDGSMDLQ
jgi:hypothetical protein